MKKPKIIAAISILCFAIAVFILSPKPPVDLSSFNRRTVWVSYYSLEKLSYNSEDEFRKGYKKILETVDKYYVDTVIVHVRPFCDALYLSKNFSQSFVVGKTLTFDPLEVMIEETHAKEMRFEAWINPYRVSLNKATYDNFVENSPKSSWMEEENKIIHYEEYKSILNPANQEVRNYIREGVKEVINNYNVDGIHFDDYFYVPGTHEGTPTQERLDNVNKLIKEVYQDIKSVDKNIEFGISPQGNYENCIAEGADIDTWLEEGYIDYLMPQIYWSNEYGQSSKEMFNDRAQQFSKIKRTKKIQLYAGLALYKAGVGDEQDTGWTKSFDQISNQVQTLYDYNYKGYGLFEYSDLLSKNGQKEMDELLRAHPY